MAEDLRQRYAEAIRGAADYPIVAEWICCDPVKPDHDLCVQGDAARKMLRAVLADDPEVLFLPSGVVDAAMAVRDEELERLKVVETASIGAHALLDEAKAALARVRAEHRVHRCEEEGHVLERTPNPCLNNGMCSCGQSGDRCPTRKALNETEEPHV